MEIRGERGPEIFTPANLGTLRAMVQQGQEDGERARNQTAATGGREMADAKPKTVTLYHPTLSAQVEVSAGSVESWTEQGWRKTKPKNSR